MHLNQFQAETEEIHIQRNCSHHVEDFLIYVSAWESWMPLYLPHFCAPLVNMASLDVTSLNSCPRFLQPTVLTGIENELQLFSVSMETTKFLIRNWAHSQENSRAMRTCSQLWHSATPCPFSHYCFQCAVELFLQIGLLDPQPETFPMN